MNDPNLTDDTFVVEAPSFIVPYVYEKPPKETIKDFKKSVQDILDKKDKEEGDGKDKKEENGKEEDAHESKDEDKSEEEVKKAEEEKKKAEEEEKKKEANNNKPKTYFESVLGKFIMDLGMNLVQESVQV